MELDGDTVMDGDMVSEHVMEDDAVKELLCVAVTVADPVTDILCDPDIVAVADPVPDGVIEGDRSI
jgi:hypothetical protein